MLIFYHVDLSSVPRHPGGSNPDLPAAENTTHEGYMIVTPLPHGQCEVTLTVAKTVDEKKAKSKKALSAVRVLLPTGGQLVHTSGIGLNFLLSHR